MEEMEEEEEKEERDGGGGGGDGVSPRRIHLSINRCACIVANNEQVQDEVNRASFRIREGRRDWKLSIFNLDMAPLGHFSRFQDVIEFLPDRITRLAVDQLSHHQNVRVSIGGRGLEKKRS